MISRQKGKKPEKYSSFVFLSAGPVGDHALIIDWANRFFESTGIPSFIIMKHPNAFLRDMAIPYYDHISYREFKGWKGKFKTALFAITSIWTKRCYVLVLPIPPPLYLKVFAQFVRFFTRSRIVALDSLCGFVLEGGPFHSARFVGKSNYIPAKVDSELYYEQANRMLSFLGYTPVARVPELAYVDTPEALSKLSLRDKAYIALHIRASGPDRSLPPDRWNAIITALVEQLPDLTFVFTGVASDMPFIEESVRGIDRSRLHFVTGVGLQELMTIYAHAKLCVTVHTGNAHLINMLHVPTVVVNFKGVHMFRFGYNRNAVDLFSEKGCTCHPLERRCSLVEHEGQGYMACLFNTTDEKIIDMVIKKYQSS